MDAVITAGGVPEPGDPLYEYTLGKPKAMLEFNNIPMIQWVINAFSDSESVENIILVGLRDSAGISANKPLFFVPDQHGMLANIRAGLSRSIDINPDRQHILLAASDIPSITSEMVTWTARNAQRLDADLYYNVVRRETMENRFPGANRTYLRLRDGSFCGGDLGAMRADLSILDRPVFHTLIGQRKNPLRQALTVGLDTLFGILTRTASLEQTARRGSRNLKVNARALECPFAEIAMDIDKPHQFELLRACMHGC